MTARPLTPDEAADLARIVQHPRLVRYEPAPIRCSCGESVYTPYCGQCGARADSEQEARSACDAELRRLGWRVL